MVTAEFLRSLAADVAAGRPVELSFDDFPCFTAEALEGRAHVTPAALAEISAGLTPADACVFERAAKAIDEGDLAWIGFKYVYDASAACENVDNEVTKKYGNVGRAAAIRSCSLQRRQGNRVRARAFPRDIFQMKDATRGPAMHTEQFDGLDMARCCAFSTRFACGFLGASDASAEVAALAHHVGFDVVAVDYDPAYISERFPNAVACCSAAETDELSRIAANPADYACVLTRDMFDPEACVWSIRNNLHYRHDGM